MFLSVQSMCTNVDTHSFAHISEHLFNIVSTPIQIVGQTKSACILCMCSFLCLFVGVQSMCTYVDTHSFAHIRVCVRYAYAYVLKRYIYIY
jgi:hypothetical protein